MHLFFFSCLPICFISPLFHPVHSSYFHPLLLPFFLPLFFLFFYSFYLLSIKQVYTKVLVWSVMCLCSCLPLYMHMTITQPCFLLIPFFSLLIALGNLTFFFLLIQGTINISLSYFYFLFPTWYFNLLHTLNLTHPPHCHSHYI